MSELGRPHYCFTCKKVKATPWTCKVCEHAGIEIEVCSLRCMRIHERDGRHRKERRIQEAKTIGLDAPPRRGARVQVRIIRKSPLQDSVKESSGGAKTTNKK
jgi:hypothetical protein